MLAAPRLLFHLRDKKQGKAYSLLMSSDYERASWKDTLIGLQSRGQSLSTVHGYSHVFSIIACCYDNHSALLMHITSSGLGYSTQPPFRHGDHDHHDEMEAGLDFYAGTIVA